MSFSSTLATQVTLSFKTDVNSSAKAIFRLSAQIEGIKNILSTNNDVILEGLIAEDPSNVLSLMPSLGGSTHEAVPRGASSPSRGFYRPTPSPMGRDPRGI
ncbi:hypothetical protein M422DRAFT_255368 [Sphaerobolus stellatus SS14]|uniref:Uncharacterized protein n=1 Tax=Sphaerobolus stellatus (strain SS14) TaxID=990650 RepID=A0A0C9VTL2_SPHS4|nr:hypothetical protein M422DRAFT_268848 [Sphaerobolus stellatus SS14]KIJ41461.1 hypothetical protein M422DRAFT_255368 [Sphaerobolus stellatus SS14]